MLRTNRFKAEEPQYSPCLRVVLETPTASTSELMHFARQLLHRMYRTGYRYKKVGVMLEGLVSKESYQPSLFETPSTQRIDIDKIVDDINRRLGDAKHPVITRGAMGTIHSSKGRKMRSELH